MPNIYNPLGLDANCVFVTIARLIRKPYNYLITTYGLMDAEPGSDMGINLEYLEARLETMRSNEEHPAKTKLHRIPNGDPNTSRYLAREKADEWGVDCVGVLYLHLDGEGGHSIVFEQDDNGGWRFWDYQNDREHPDPPSIVAVYYVRLDSQMS